MSDADVADVPPGRAGPRASEFYPDRDGAANTTVAQLRAAAGRDPYDSGLSDLIGELCTHSEEFRTRWAAHNVRLHQTGLKHFHHPVVGGLDLAFDAMELSASPDLKLIAYSAEPGSPSQDALNLLASWAATLDRDDRRDHPRHRRSHAVSLRHRADERVRNAMHVQLAPGDCTDRASPAAVSRPSSRRTSSA